MTTTRPSAWSQLRLAPIAVVALLGGSLRADTIADSFDDWSSAGVQGERGWTSGWWNRTADADGLYAPEDLEPFRNTAGAGGGAVSLDGNHWNGSAWDLDGGSRAPWTTLGREHVHPDAASSAFGNELWPIRRWTSDRSGAVVVEWHARKTNPRGGGVTAHLFVGGREVGIASIAGDDTDGVTRLWRGEVEIGDAIDLALDPGGPEGDRSEGSDGSATRLRILDALPEGAEATTTLAHSVADWSVTGTQGEKGWSYGYYDQGSDLFDALDPGYDVDDFRPFARDGSTRLSATNHWNGSFWDLADNQTTPDSPWTQLAAASAHPAAESLVELAVHWSVRRWVCDSDGDVRIRGSLRNLSSSGDGTVGRVFLNGVELWSAHSNGEAIDYELAARVRVGDLLDLAVDADGSGVVDPLVPFTLGFVSSSSDSTLLTVEVVAIAPPVVDGRELFRRGDADDNGVVELSDAVTTLDALFRGGAAPRCADAADANDDGSIDLSDAVSLLSWLFLGGAEPPAPGASACGADPTADSLTDCATESCPTR